MKPKLFSNKLLHEIIFKDNYAKSDLEEENWLEKYRCFAEIKPLYDNKSGSLEKFSFGHVVTENFYMFKMRFTSEINTKSRIYFKERIFEIKRIINVLEKNKIIQIIALEI